MKKRSSHRIGFSAKVTGIRNQQGGALAQQRSAQARLIVEQTPAVVWATDANLRITSIWGAPLHSLNLPCQEYIGRTLYECFGTSDPLAPYIADHRKALDGTSVTFDAEYKSRAFRIRVEPFKDCQSRVIGTIGVALDVTEQKLAEESMRYLALHDPLTGLANYRALVEAFDKELQRSDRTGRPFAVLLLDMDRLKEINDRHGHLVGSRVLCRLANVLKRTCRSTDIPTRYGGDEFGILLAETDRVAALHLARRITDCLAADGEEPLFTVSMGIAVYSEDGYTVENLLASADRDLYRNKLRKDLQIKACAAQRVSREAAQAKAHPELRRSERLPLDVSLLVRGESIEGLPFHEETFTISVSAHGALLILAAKVVLGQTLVLRNLQTQDEAKGMIARFSPPYGGLSQVAIEFLRPVPWFWHVDPLPKQWKMATVMNTPDDGQCI